MNGCPPLQLQEKDEEEQEKEKDNRASDHEVWASRLDNVKVKKNENSRRSPEMSDTIIVKRLIMPTGIFQHTVPLQIPWWIWSNIGISVMSKLQDVQLWWPLIYKICMGDYVWVHYLENWRARAKLPRLLIVMFVMSWESAGARMLMEYLIEKSRSQWWLKRA